MHYYLVPAKTEDNTTEPDMGSAEFQSWAGVYDRDSDCYVIRTAEPLEGLTELEPGQDVGIDYSSLVKEA